MVMCWNQVTHTDEDSKSTPYDPVYDGKDKDMIIQAKDESLKTKKRKLGILQG